MQGWSVDYFILWYFLLPLITDWKDAPKNGLRENNIVECCLQFIPQHIQKRKVGSYNLGIIDRNIFSLKLPKNENIQLGPEKQYSYIKKSKRKE